MQVGCMLYQPVLVRTNKTTPRRTTTTATTATTTTILQQQQQHGAVYVLVRPSQSQTKVIYIVTREFTYPSLASVPSYLTYLSS